MSEAGFTPGPWLAGQDGNNRVYGPDRLPEHSGLLAVVYKGRANVNLIAAAPLGYAFAETVEAAIVDGDLADSEVWGPILSECRAFMAKARGEA